MESKKSKLNRVKSAIEPCFYVLSEFYRTAIKSNIVEVAPQKPAQIIIASQPRQISAPLIADNNESAKSTTISVSDVDTDIPITKDVNDHVFAFIFANENYQDVAKVPNAINDGESMAKYCQQTLGLPNTNIHLVKDATLNNIRREINMMKRIAAAYNGDASFIVYYAGHGIPDESSLDAYLMPIDGFVGDLSTCLSIKYLYESLGEMPVTRNIVFLDACFSGATRNNEMLSSVRGVAIKPKESKPKGNTLVIASSQGNETSCSYDEKQHGLFTYFVLKKLQESKGNTTMGDLVDFVKDNVVKKSLVVIGKSQTPMASPSQNINTQWQNWTLK